MRTSSTFKNHHQEQRVIAVRLLWAVIIVAALSLVLTARLFWLQSKEHERYITLSDKNRVQTLAVSPPRGLIYDRHGRLLALNQPNFSLSVIPEQAADLAALIEQLRHWVDLDKDDMRSCWRRRTTHRRPWEPVLLKAGLTEEQIAQIVARQHQLPGVRINAIPTRRYPYGSMLAHLLGYVNRINTADLERMS